ncbi:MAG TPA: SMC-Scp complex subunit ScpB [Chitinophagaceae bacterium]|nr:SMC-Scp complex subunit ScpB [Chitinophagaceae bacterium]
MEIGNIIPHIEAVIFASDKALTSLEITEIINNAFGFMEDKIVLDQVEAAIEGIVEKYNSEFYPFEIRQSGGGWQFLTKRDYHKTIAQLNGDKFLKRLSSAALETLAIIAYKQPITKSEIEAIRGVNCDYAVQRLLEKDLVIITGRNEQLPGKPLIYTTSKSFMDYFGINSADDLPKIKEVLADQAVEATYINNTDQENNNGQETEAIELLVEEEGAAFLAVAPNGELITALEEETLEATEAAAPEAEPEASFAPQTEEAASQEQEENEEEENEEGVNEEEANEEQESEADQPGEEENTGGDDDADASDDEEKDQSPQ